MKILYVGHTYTVSANHAKIRALAAEPNVEIMLVTPQGWRGPLYDNQTDRLTGIPNVRHEIVRGFGLGREGIYVYRPGALGKLLAAFQPDVLHVEQGAYALSYLQILRAAKRFSSKTRASFFTWWNLPYRPRGIKGFAERYNLSHSAGSVAGNQDAANILRDHGFGGEITVLPQLGVELSSSVTPTKREAGEPLRIGYIGRVEPEKGVLDLANAFLTMQQRAELTVLGVGRALAEMQRITNHSSNAHYLPAVRNEDVPLHLERLHVLVLPSRSTPEWVEQFGHILIEAMALGVAVVGSDSGEIPNVIVDAGRIFQEGDVKALASALDELAANEPERVLLAAAAIERVRRYFTNAAIAKRQMSFFESLLTSPITVASRRTATILKELSAV